MQAKQKPVIATVIVCAAVLLVFLIWALAKIPSAADIESAVKDEVAEISIPAVPTAAEIAAELGTASETEEDNSDVLEGIYEDEVDDLEQDCVQALSVEYAADLEKELRDLLEADLGDDVKDVSVVDWNYRDDYEFNVVNLGLDEEEDRAGSLSVYFRVKFHEMFGDSDWHFEKVRVDASCADWDSRDNEFDSVDVSYAIV